MIRSLSFSSRADVVSVPLSILRLVCRHAHSTSIIFTFTFSRSKFYFLDFRFFSLHFQISLGVEEENANSADFLQIDCHLQQWVKVVSDESPIFLILMMQLVNCGDFRGLAQPAGHLPRAAAVPHSGRPWRKGRLQGTTGIFEKSDRMCDFSATSRIWTWARSDMSITERPLSPLLSLKVVFTRNKKDLYSFVLPKKWLLEKLAYFTEHLFEKLTSFSPLSALFTSIVADLSK